MNIAKDLRKFLISAGLTSSDQIFVSRSSSVDLTENDQWAVAQQPGSRSGGNLVQWKRTYNLLLLYRNSNGDELYNKDDVLQEILEQCVLLDNYKVLRVTPNPMGEVPIEQKEVHIAQWQIAIDAVKKLEEES